MPDVDLMRNQKDMRLIQEIADVARENWKGIRGPTGGVDLSRALGKLEYELLDMMNPGAEDDPPDTPSIVANTRLGYVIGIMENGSGVAHAGECESHYSMAMIMISAEIAQMAPPTTMSEFGLEAGYYLARTNDRTIEALLGIAERNAEALGAKPNPLSSTEQDSAVGSPASDPPDGGVIYSVENWRHSKVVELVRALEAVGIPYEWDNEREEGVLLDRKYEAAVDTIISQL